MKRVLLAVLTSFTMMLVANTASAEDLNKSLDDALASKPIHVKFSAVFDTPVDSRLADVDDPIEAHLLQDLVIDDAVVAKAGTKIVGHVTAMARSRSLTQSLKSKNDRFRRHASVSVAFDKIVFGPDNEMPIKGLPAEQVYFFTNEGQFKRIVIGIDGELLKAGSMDMTPLSSDAQIPIPDTWLGLHHAFQVKVVPGDIVPVNATIMDDDLNFRSVNARLVGSKSTSAQ